MPDKVVDIPGVGSVAFPDSMTPDEMNKAAAKLYAEANPTAPAPPGQVQVPMTFAMVNGQPVPMVNGERVPASAEQFMPAPPPRPGTPYTRFEDTVGESFNPLTIAQGLYQTLRHPVQTAQAIEDLQHAEKAKAAAAWQEGNTSEAFGHGLASVMPVLGPAAAHAGERIGRGEIAEGLGEGVGLLTSLLMPGVVSRRAGQLPALPVLPRLGRNVPPPVAEAVQFGLREGIPVDPVTATGNRYLRGIQRLGGKTMAGSLVEGSAIAEQEAALAATGQRLAGRTSQAARIPEEAGEGALAALKARAAALNATAGRAYDKLRAFEAAHGLAVDLTATKTAMRPIYEALQKEHALVPFMSGSQKGKALVMLDKLLKADDLVPLSVADGVLGEIKAMARVSDDFRRTVGQGIAARTVGNLETAVQTTARQAGPDVFQALMDGRAATVNKVKTIELLDKFGEDALGAFTKATSPTKIAQLRALARVAPQEVAAMGRAWLEQALTKATQEGGFLRSDGLIRDWQRLNPQAKQLLFGGPAHVKDLDDFFLLAKKLAENPNPSGSAFTAFQGLEAGAVGAAAAKLSPWALLETLGTYGVTRLLYSPTTTRLLLQGLRLPVSAKVARAAWVVQLERALQQSTPLVPAVTETGKAPDRP